MKVSRTSCLVLLLLTASFASAQIPCGPTISPKASLFVNWSQYRFDAQHSGCNPYETILSTATVGGLVLDWKYATSTPVSGDPAVVNGLLYFTSSYPENTLYALNARTGVLIWKYAAGQNSLSAPVVVNGVVYVGAFTQSFSGLVYAFKAGTGELLWQHTTTNQIDAAPTVSGGVVYVGDDSGTLYALNASTGTLLWTYNTPNQTIGAPAAVANGIVYFASVYPAYPNWSTTLYALDTATQQVLWRYDWNDAIGDTPVVGNGEVFFNSYAFNAKTGTMLYDAPVRFFSLPAVANGVVYVGSDDNNVYALNASTGQIKWIFRTGNFVASAPAVANGVVYIESDDGNFYALNAGTGAPLWQYKVSNSGASGPAVANGLVYIGSQDLYTFHLPGQ